MEKASVRVVLKTQWACRRFVGQLSNVKRKTIVNNVVLNFIVNLALWLLCPPYCVLSLPHCVWFHSGFVKHYLGSCICLVLIWRVSVKSKSVPLVRVAAINLFKLISCRRWCGQSQVIGRCRLVHGKDGTAWPKTVPSGTSKVLDYPFHGGLKARRSGDPEHGRLQWNWILKRPQAFTFAKKEGRFVR